MILSARSQSTSLKAKLFRGFSDSSRLAILEVLRSRPMTVSEIVEATGLSQSNTSNHLGCLRDCGLVNALQQGRFTSYQIADPRVTEILETVDELLADVAKGVYECTRYNCSKNE